MKTEWKNGGCSGTLSLKPLFLLSLSILTGLLLDNSSPICELLQDALPAHPAVIEGLGTPALSAENC